MNYMEKATELGYKACSKEEIPVGAVIVKNNKIISKAYNTRERSQVATHHAEILAIEKACKKLKTWHLEECEIYITMEPCLMCTGAIIQARIPIVYYAVNNEKFGISNYFDIEKKVKINNHYIQFYGGYLKKETQSMLKVFFETKRRKN